MSRTFTCPFTGQKNYEINKSDDGVVIYWYYPVQIGDKKKYIKIGESFYASLIGVRVFDFKDELDQIKPIILYELINDNLKRFGGTIMHWDSKFAEGKPDHINLKDLLKIIEEDNTYPRTIRQKMDNFLLYIKKNQNFAGGKLYLKDDPIIWGNLFFLNYEEMLFYIKELEKKNLLHFDGRGNNINLTLDGLEYIENIKTNSNTIVHNVEYKSTDKFDEQEKAILRVKIDEFGNQLKRIEVGQQITYDDLMAELEILKQLLGVLGKKDWKQILYGKLVDAGFGALVDQVVSVFIDIFQDDRLIEG